MARLQEKKTGLQETKAESQHRKNELEGLRQLYHDETSQMKRKLTEQKQEHETVVQQLQRELSDARNMLQVWHSFEFSAHQMSFITFLPKEVWFGRVCYFVGLSIFLSISVCLLTSFDWVVMKFYGGSVVIKGTRD